MPPSNRPNSATHSGVSTRIPLRISLSPRTLNRLIYTTLCWRSTPTGRGVGEARLGSPFSEVIPGSRREIHRKPIGGREKRSLHTSFSSRCGRHGPSTPSPSGFFQTSGPRRTVCQICQFFSRKREGYSPRAPTGQSPEWREPGVCCPLTLIALGLGRTDDASTRRRSYDASPYSWKRVPCQFGVCPARFA